MAVADLLCHVFHLRAGVPARGWQMVEVGEGRAELLYVVSAPTEQRERGVPHRVLAWYGAGHAWSCRHCMAAWLARLEDAWVSLGYDAAATVFALAAVSRGPRPVSAGRGGAGRTRSKRPRRPRRG